MDILLSQNWEIDDKPIYFIHNFTDQREVLDVTIPEKVDNETIPENWLEQGSHGQNLILNDTATREIHLIVAGDKK